MRLQNLGAQQKADKEIQLRLLDWANAYHIRGFSEHEFRRGGDGITASHVAGPRIHGDSLIAQRDGDASTVPTSLPSYHADLYFPDLKLIVECEGEGSASRDNPERDAYFEGRGIAVLHFPNSYVWGHAEEIAQTLGWVAKKLGVTF